MRDFPVGDVRGVLLDRPTWYDAVLGLPPLDV